MTSVLLHIVVLAAGTWFFRECARWGYRCLGRRRWRELLWRWGSRLVYLAAAVDLVVLVFSMLQGWLGLDVPARDLVLLRTLFFAPSVLVAVVVLFTGLRRFALPWTVPAAADARISNESVQPARLVSSAGDWRNPEPIPGPNPPPPDPEQPEKNWETWYVHPKHGTGESAGFETYEPARYAIGLSGGGIRSAAFCSGVLQSLARTPWSPTGANYLATVSGGGYVGVSSQIIRHSLRGTHPADGIDPYADDAPETTGFSRRHRYLGDDALERAQVLLALLTGWVLNAVLIAGPLVLIGTGLAVVPTMPANGTATLVAHCGAVLALAVAGALLLCSGAEGSADRLSQWLDSSKKDLTVSKEFADSLPTGRLESVAKKLRWWAGVLVVAGSLIIVVSTDFSWTWLIWPPAFGAVGLLFCVYANRKSDPFTQNISRVLFVAAWASVGLIGIGISASGTLGNPTSWADLTADRFWPAAWPTAAVALLAAFLFLDQTSWSPHPFYKARIAATFALRRIQEGARRDFQVLPYDEYSYLDDWAAPVTGGPKLLVCATANAEDISLPPEGTRAVPFVFSHDYVGSPELGWWETAEFRRCLGRQLAVDGTLQAATAISGAAVASGLGVKGRIPSVGTALALLNARLGVWLPNPHAPAEKYEWPDDGPQPHSRWHRFRSTWRRRRKPLWLWREVAGFLPSNKRFIYVSDGGHLDNLGLLELLRRRSQTILIVDASADEKLTTRTLNGVLELAQKHFGIRHEWSEKTSPLNIESSFYEGRSDVKVRGVAKDCVDCLEITYPKLGASPEATGVVVVAKARLARSLNEYQEARDVVEAIEGSNAWRWWPWSLQSMPTTLTANQSLTDDQFRNYVQLGRAVGHRAVAQLNRLNAAGRDADETGGHSVAS